MNNHYTFYRIVDNNIEEYEASKEMAFKTVYWWLYEMPWIYPYVLAMQYQ